MEGYQQGEGGRRTGEKVQGISRIDRYKIDRGKLRIVFLRIKNSSLEKPKNLYVQHELSWRGGNAGGRVGARQRGIKG